jgi:hypothetical protein
MLLMNLILKKMPIPKPNSGESESEFMSRCVSFLVNEGTDNEQAVAICSNEWNNKKSMKAAKLNKIKALFNNEIILK